MDIFETKVEGHATPLNKEKVDSEVVLMNFYLSRDKSLKFKRKVFFSQKMDCSQVKKVLNSTYPVCEGNEVILIATEDFCPLPRVQWQVSSDDGATWQDLPETCPVLNFIAELSQNGNLYRAKIQLRCECYFTNSTQLVVNNIQIVQNPTNQCAQVGDTVEFNVQVDGSPFPQIQWQTSHNELTWIDLPGETSSTLSFTVTANQLNEFYRARILNSCGQLFSQSAQLQFLIITLQPESSCTPQGQTVTFTSQAEGTLPFQIQWQVNSGSGWEDLPGENSLDLSFTVLSSDAGNLYRVIFSNSCGEVISNEAQLEIATFMAVFLAGDENFTVESAGNFAGLGSGPWTYQNPNWQVNGSNSEATSCLISPVLDVISSGNHMVVIDHGYQFIQGNGGNLELNVNGGSFNVVPGTSFTMNGYDSNMIIGLGNEEGWTGTSGAIQSIANLGNFSEGDTLQLKLKGGWIDSVSPLIVPNWVVSSIMVPCPGNF